MTDHKPAWTPGRMAFLLPPAVERYMLARSSSYSPQGDALFADTIALGNPAVMMLAREQYALFRFLAAPLRWRRVLDIGTFTGLSAQAFAEGMASSAGRVVTIDRDRGWLDIARRHWTAAGVADRIDVLTGEALPMLRGLSDAPDLLFDFIFIDADKALVRDYVDEALRLLAPGGLIGVDNALWHGWVMDENHRDTDTDGMRAFNDRMAQDTRIETVMLPIADGLTLIRRR
ncbi:MAG: O-methyltransferase [Pseudolabrys sp.]|nr:O-methyltransferase [Pseudolabrys sp.]